MIIKDKVYGKERIHERILLDLLSSKSLERLKGISQFGMPDEYYHRKNFSRYEHSIGVFVLLRKLGADLEEQVAGLLHDVSHTAFSHVIDWVIGDPTKEDYQDSIHQKIIRDSDIPKILTNHGLNYKSISNLEKFSLLEREPPHLCADRIDYTLRELEMERGKIFTQNLFCDLKNIDGQIVFMHKNTAKIFATEYIRLQKEHWGGDQARARFYVLSNVLTKALNSKILSTEDFKKTDYEVLNKLNSSRNKEILKDLNLLKRELDVQESKNGIELKNKFRHIDPEIFLNESIIKLSEISKEYKRILDFEMNNSQNFKKVEIKE